MSLKHTNPSGRKAAKHGTDYPIELSLLLEQVQGRNKLIVKLLATTGITVSELVNIQAQDLTGRELHIPAKNTKNNTQRTIILSPSLSHELKALARQPGSHLFSTRQSQQLTTRRVEQILKEAAEKTETTLTAHDLRRAYQRQAARKANNNQELQELTGLKSITKKNIVTEQEQEKLLARTTGREHALLELLLETSISLGQALTLTTNEVKTTSINLKDRTIPISPSLSHELKALARQPGSHLFSTRQSQQLTPRRAEQLISALGKGEGIELSARLLRATAITRIAQEYGEEEAQRRAGIKAPLTYKYGILGGGRP